MNIQGYPCQKVCGAKETPISVESVASAFIQPPDEENQSEITPKNAVRPAGSAAHNFVMLHYCHYQKLEDGGMNCLKNWNAATTLDKN